jgi:spermidine/putrescine transport system substrate-binding protein
MNMNYKKDDLVEMFATGQMSRRKFNKYLTSLGVTTVTMPMWSGAARAAAEDHPNVFTWEGWDAKLHHLEYHNKYGEYPNFSIFGDEEEAFAKIKAGAQYDVLHPCSYKVEIWRDAGIIQPIDTSMLSHWDELIPSLKEMPGMTVNGDVYFVAADWGLTSVLYRPDLVDEKYQEDETWGILWDERYAGRISMSDSLIDGVMVAAIYGGAKDPFNMTNEEVEVTRELLRKQLPLLRYWWSSPTDLENSMAAGELVATSSWNDAYTALKAAGINVKYMNPKEGAMTWVCGFCLASDADPAKLEKAHDAIDAFLSPDSGVLSILDEGYGHSNVHSYDLVPESLLQERGLSKDPESILSAGIFQEPIGNEAVLQAMFEEIKAGL